jgi:hypothetical protein
VPGIAAVCGSAYVRVDWCSLCLCCNYFVSKLKGVKKKERETTTIKDEKDGLHFTCPCTHVLYRRAVSFMVIGPRTHCRFPDSRFQLFLLSGKHLPVVKQEERKMLSCFGASIG